VQTQRTRRFGVVPSASENAVQTGEPDVETASSVPALEKAMA
jgi:hypothetical protein